MAVTAETPIASSVANGVTTVFPHSFTVLDADDFVATGTLNGVTTTYEEGVDFTLTGVGTSSGSMVFGAAPANGTVVVRWRDTQIERSTDYQNNGDLLAGTVNADFNRLYYLFQEVFNGGKGVPTSLRVPNGETINALPAAADRANRIQAYDAQGQSALIVGVDSGSAAALDLDLRSIVSSTKGAGQVGFDWPLLYDELSAGWGIRTATNQQNVLRWIEPSAWAGILDGTTAVDVSSEVQSAIDEISAGGGGTLFVPGTLLCNTPIRLVDGVDLVGNGYNTARLKKNSNTTLTCTVTPSVLVGCYPGALPADLNAVLILDGAGQRYTGVVRDLTIEGTYTTPGDNESQKVEFGIVSTGSVSDYTCERVKIISVQYAQIYPVIFVAEIRRNRMIYCLNGLGINNGTSTNIANNYANGCLNYGYFIRDLKYSEVTSNACDFLNDPSRYPTRTRTCAAYTFRSCLGLTVTANGDENTYGRSLVFNEFDHSVCEGHVTVDIGSDYAGADEIAWIYSTATMRASRVMNNAAYGVKSTGLVSGGANPAKHHNIYFEGLTFVQAVDFKNNVVRASRTGTIVEAGWGNNVPTAWLNSARGDGLVYSHSPVFQAQVMGDLSVVYGADNHHIVEQCGALLHVWGCFDVTPTYTTATGLVVINSFPANGSKSGAVGVQGVQGGSGLAAKLGWFEFAAASTGGVGRTDGDGNFVITDIASGTRVRIHYDGWYSTV